MSRLKPHWLAAGLALLPALLVQGQAVPKTVHGFVDAHCTECHDADTKKGGLDLVSLNFGLPDPATFSKWVKINDRVAAGEMPPKKKARPVASELKAFTNTLSAALLVSDRERVAKEGRATQRRLNRYEYEETLRDLLSLP